MKVLISDIAVIHRQRSEIDPKAIAELAESIRTVGLLHAIVVRDPYAAEQEECRELGATYVLMVGGRRLAAHMMLGLLEIEATHRRDLGEVEAEIAELDENRRRANISWEDEVAATARIAELRMRLNPDANLVEIAAEMGLSQAKVYADVQLHREIKRDPTILQATSRNAAQRLSSRKKDVAKRLSNVQGQQLESLRSRIVCADAVEYARSLPSASVQMIFTDLPYGIDYFEVARGSETSAGRYNDEADACRAFIERLVPEMARVVKPTGWIVLFMCYEWHVWLQDLLRDVCAKHGDFSICLDASNEGCAALAVEMPPWVWARPGKGSFGHWPELHAANRYEMIVVANGGKATLAKKPVENLLLYPQPEGLKRHAHEKPLDLCRELIERCSLVGESVVDFCFGSGAHLAAAASLGRDFRGCDNNPENLAVALTYVAEHYHGDAVLRAIGATNG